VSGDRYVSHTVYDVETGSNRTHSGGVHRSELVKTITTCKLPNNYRYGIHDVKLQIDRVQQFGAGHADLLDVLLALRDSHKLKALFCDKSVLQYASR
jgi:hypothetical protein